MNELTDDYFDYFDLRLKKNQQKKKMSSMKKLEVE
jgi:hypothetical protein